jgi:hypothetical protein
MKKIVLLWFVFCVALAVPAITKDPVCSFEANAAIVSDGHAAGMEFAEDENPVPVPYARLICYREKKFAGSALSYTIWLDGAEVADLKNGTYFVIRATPGEHKLHADEEEDEFAFVVEAGKTYYYRAEMTVGVWKGHGRLAPVEASFGEMEFKKLLPKLKYSKNIRNFDLVERPGAAAVEPAVEPEKTEATEETEG